MIDIECINITSLETQLEALIVSRASVVFFQEHKVRTNDIKRIRKQFAKAGWRTHLSPCDEGGKKASAGVGSHLVGR